MKRIVRLTERDLSRIVKRIVKEENEEEVKSFFKRAVSIIGDTIISNTFPEGYDLKVTDRFGIASTTSEKIQDLLNRKYPNYEIRWDFDLNNDENIFYYLMDENGNDILEYPMG